MTAIQIQLGSIQHTIPLPEGGAWSPLQWRGSSTDLDLGLYSRAEGQFAVFEMRVGNTSIVIGQKGKPTITANVSVKLPRGFSIAWDAPRPFPNEWYPMRETARRFVVYPSDRALAKKAQEIAGLEPDHVPESIGPCNMPLPSIPDAAALAVQSNMAHWLAGLHNALQYGTAYHLEDSEDGPVLPTFGGWRPHGPFDRDRPAGSGVYHDTGWQDDPSCVPVFWLQAACAHERFWHVYRRDTGLPVTADDYPDGAIKYQAGTGDPNNGWLPELVGVAPWPDPLPLPYDSAHSIRGFRHAVALSEMTDSPMVKHMIASQAASFRLQLGEKGAPPAFGYTPANLRNYIATAQANPKAGGGLEAGRVMGWPMFIWAQDIKINGSPGSKAVAVKAVEWANTCAMRNGVTQRVMHGAPALGHEDVWFDPTWDLAHSFEVPIGHFGFTGCAIQSGEPVPDAMQRAAVSLLEDVPKGPYYSGDVGPMDYLYVAHRGGAPVYPLAGGKPGSDQVIGDPTHQENFAALAFEVTKNQKFIDDALHVGTVADTRAEKLANLEARTNLYGHAFLLALLQENP